MIMIDAKDRVEGTFSSEAVILHMLAELKKEYGSINLGKSVYPCDREAGIWRA